MEVEAAEEAFWTEAIFLYFIQLSMTNISVLSAYVKVMDNLPLLLRHHKA